MITVPRATRHQRPVYIGTNPLSGTYRRNGEGDYKCDGEAVKRMIAESQTDARDGEIIEDSTLDDLHLPSLIAYRNRFASSHPAHPWLTLDNQNFLQQLGAIREDRETKDHSLTLAGLVMFGSWLSIRERLPQYQLDFREYSENTVDWIDRVIPDGTWSGNVFDFFFLVYPRLVRDLKVPFQLDSEQRRIDDTDVHKAIREALTNSLVHADYTVSGGITICKYPNKFEFRNPGLSRVPPLQAIVNGGLSDCRNPSMQTMFRMIGIGDSAGSGFSRIVQAWQAQHYTYPLFRDSSDDFLSSSHTSAYSLEYSNLLLPLQSFISPEITATLMQHFGEAYKSLLPDARMALAIAVSEGQVTNTRLRQISVEHPRDLTVLLQDLVKRGFLESEGQRRGTSYHLPQSFDSDNLSANTQKNSPLLNENSPLLNENSPLSKQGLYEIAAIVRNSKKVSKKEVQQTIFTLCANTWLQLSEIAELLGRDAKYVQEKYLTFMVRQELLQMKFPNTPNHPQQQYKAVLQANEDSNNFTLFP
ncbi:MAG: ATP-binding protein [Candidatus Kapaibacteriota bacterium]